LEARKSTIFRKDSISKHYFFVKIVDGCPPGSQNAAKVALLARFV